MVKKIIAFFTAFFFQTTAFAAEPAAMPGKGIDRIKWAAQCCGKIPDRMIVAFVLLVVCAVAAIIYYKSISGGDKDAR